MARILTVLTLLLLATPVVLAANRTVTVAADGSGDVRTVAEAIARVPEGNKSRFTILIKAGVYNEQIVVPSSKPYVSFVGEKAETTKITFSLAARDAGSTSGSFAVYIGGHDFRAENISFENSFGQGSQAVAVLVEADRAVFVKCRFLAWQDTLYTKRGRQYYKDCYVEGSVDFIFGQATAVFEGGEIRSKTDGYVAAPMRFAADEPTGIVFIKSRLTATPNVAKVFLARPWRPYGRTVYIDADMGAHIRPEGWNNWGKTENEKTAYFAESGSKGPGGDQSKRAGWMHRLTEKESKAFYPKAFLRGKDGWNPLKNNAKWQEKTPPDFRPVAWNEVLGQTFDWFQTDEAGRIGGQVVGYQNPNGGWPAGIDFASVLTQAQRLSTRSPETSFDPSATVFALRFLARYVTASLAKSTPPANTEAAKKAFAKGVEALSGAGRSGETAAFLKEVAEGKGDFAFTRR